MFDESLLKMLVCPESRTPLSVADEPLVNRLNGEIARRKLTNKGGRTLETPLDGALVREDRKVAYPVIDGIPMLLADEGIVIER